MRRVILPLVLTLLLPLDATAQVPSLTVDSAQFRARSLDGLEGALLRLSDAGRPELPPIVGRLVESRADSLFINTDDEEEPLVVLLAPSTKVEQWRRRDSTGSFMALFGGIGGLVGGVAGYKSGDDGPDLSDVCPDATDATEYVIGCFYGGYVQSAGWLTGRVFSTVAGAALGAAGGMLLGRLVGGAQRSEGWEPVNPPRIQVRPASHGQVEIGIQLRR